MVQHERENGAWAVWRTALDRRQDARRTAMSEDEFSPQEIEAYELDTARITGEDNDRTYHVEPWGDDEGPIDYREVDPRF